MSKKIAIISPVFPPYAGGIGNVAYHNARMLQKLGYEVTVFTPDYGGNEITADFKIVKIKPALKYGNAAFVPKLGHLLSEFDIVHLHYPFFGGAEVVWQARKSAKKLVLHYHMDVVGKGVLGLFFRAHRSILLPKIISSADKIIVTSFDYAKNSDIKKFIEANPEKFIELPCGVDVEKFRPQYPDSELKSMYGLENKKVILFVGTLDKAHYFKGVNYLISALKQINNDNKLIIVGEGELLDDYKRQAKDLELEKRVIFAGKVSSQDLSKYYNLADVIVLPSIDKSEAFGLVLVEAMACGKPVVASNLAGVRTVVGECGFLAMLGDVNDLAEKINKILASDEDAKIMGQKGLQKVKEKYSWEKIGEKLDILYKDVFASD